MLGRQRPGKLKSRRVVHKSTGGMLNPIPAPVDPVGNAPSSSLNTVAHPRAPGALALSLTGRGIWNQTGGGKKERFKRRRASYAKRMLSHLTDSTIRQHR